jgi:hypothetical protein
MAVKYISMAKAKALREAEPEKKRKAAAALQEKERSEAEYRRGCVERFDAYWKWYDGLSTEDQKLEDEEADREQAANDREERGQYAPWTLVRGY